MRIGRPHGRERGAAAVEMAIVLPLLLLVIAGIIDFGRAFFYEIQLANAAREGARAAVVSDLTAAQVQARALNSAGGIPTSDISFPVLTLCSSGVVNATVQVRANFQWLVLKPVVGIIGGTWNQGNALSSTAVMQCGG